MSGHSKWSTIKHKKGKEDARRGQLFSKLAACHHGGGARGRRRPRLQRRAGGRHREGAQLQHAQGQHRPRDPARLRRGRRRVVRAHHLRGLRPRGGGDHRRGAHRQPQPLRLRACAASSPSTTAPSAQPGSVAWIFERRGSVIVDAGKYSEDDVMAAAIEGGADDVVRDGEAFQVLTRAGRAVGGARGDHSRPASSTSRPSSRCMPKITVQLDEADARKTLRLVDALEDSDDVQDVYANFDIPEEVLAGGRGLALAARLGRRRPGVSGERGTG